MRMSDFVNLSYDYRPNWTPLSPVTITYLSMIIWYEFFDRTVAQITFIFIISP